MWIWSHQIKIMNCDPTDQTVSCVRHQVDITSHERIASHNLIASHEIETTH